MKSGKGFAALGLALILCVFLAACGGSSKSTSSNPPVIYESSLPPGAVNAPYSTTVHVVQGTGTSPYAFSIVSGSLPAGLAMDVGGNITGTPTTIGNSSFTVQVKDGNNLTGTRMLSINVRGAVSVNPATLPGGTVSMAYSATVTATGGILPYTWSVSSGTLPAGLALTSNPDGSATISGTPTMLGTSTFTLQVADSESPPATGVSPPLSIAIEGFLTITNTSLPTGYVSIFYDTQLMATGGTPPYAWSLTSGTLPPGLTLTPATGVISGTPTTTGSYPITVQVVDSERIPAMASGSFTITIDPTPQLQITTSSLAAATQGIYFNAPLAATGGVPPYSWSITSGSLPAGLTLSGTGVISGTTNTTGTFPITVQVTDSDSPTRNTATADLTLTVNAGPLVIDTIGLPAGTESVPYNATLAAAGGTPPYTWSLYFGSLPTGLTLDPSSGLISGTPTATNTSSIQVKVQDSASHSALSPSLAIVINAALTNAALTGDYAFSFVSYNTTTPVFIAGRLTADGNGNISNGLLDGNGAGSVPVTSLPFTGTYSITASGLGTMTFNPTAGPPINFAIVANSSGSGRLIQSDPTNPNLYGSGAIKPQTVGNLTGGNFVFGANGVDVSGNRYASVGGFQLKATGGLNSGEIDINDGGTVTPAASLSGSYSIPDPNTGRGTASLSVNGSPPQNFSYYVVSSTELVQLSVDQVSDTSPATLASVLRTVTAGAGFTNVALKGTSVLQANGIDPNGGSPEAVGITGLFTGDGTADGNGFGNATLLYDQNTGGTLAQQQVIYGQYKVNQFNGRVTLNGFGGAPPVLYLANLNQAFVLGTDGNTTAGTLTPQVSGTAGVPIGNNSVLGTYIGGSFPPDLPTLTNQVAWLQADGNGNINASQDTSGPGGPQTNQFAVTYQVDSTGRALVYSNPGGTLQGILYLVSPTKIGILSTDTNPVLSTFTSGKSTN
jgi:hypothetical protein